jgi:hypothetical protein
VNVLLLALLFAWPPTKTDRVEALQKQVNALSKRVDDMQKRMDVLPSLRAPKPDVRPAVKMAEFLPLFLENRPTLDPGEHEYDQHNPKMNKFYKWARPWVDYRKVENWPCQFVTTEQVKGETYSAQVTFDGPTGRVFGLVMLRADLPDTTAWFEKFKRGKKLILVEAKLCGVGTQAISFCSGRFSDPEASKP